ncbi:hypothetical protein ACSBR2_018974 [Camellia fascicularis]
MENIRSTIEIGKNLCDLTGPWVGYHNNLVKLWQEDVRRITDDVQTLEGQELEVRGLKNAFKRVVLGKRVVETIKEVEKLLENGGFSNGLLIDDPTCGHAIPIA